MKKPKFVSPFHGPITDSFLEEVETYRLQFKCQQCAFFNETDESCVHGYPNERHLSSYFEHDAIGKVLVFCRDFECSEDHLD